MLNSPSSLHVLVIDDHEDLGQIFAILFKIIGCTCELTGSGEKGLRIAKEKIPHLIFCDLNMPGVKNGFDVAREIRSDQRWDSTLLIAVTGDYDNDAKALDAGFDRVYRKPVKFAQINELVADYLAMSREKRIV